MDFLSRIGGLQSGIGLGPIFDDNKKIKNEKNNIIKRENIYDTRNDSEIEDIHIKPSDEIFICLGLNEDRECSSMKFNVFDTELRTFYEHHNIVLPAIPLCCKWLRFDKYGKI